MNSYDIETLNEDQKKALLKIEGAVLVTAGAGSGKTKLLTHRIAYLIKELNVSPYRILALTFTNKAAKEMRERVSSMIDGNESDKVWISTFHSMCVKILRSNIHKVEGYNSNFSIYSDADTDRVLKRIYA
ncbi:MAG: UvrD-helicase domain-containing protein, partial [Clostridia bacterium]